MFSHENLTYELHMFNYHSCVRVNKTFLFHFCWLLKSFNCLLLNKAYFKEALISSTLLGMCSMSIC